MNPPPSTSSTSTASASASAAKTATRDASLVQLAREKSAISTRLTIVMLSLYFGFVVLLAFTPQVLGARVGNATLGIPLGIGVILGAWILTGIYTRWANTRYDSLAAQIRRDNNE